MEKDEGEEEDEKVEGECKLPWLGFTGLEIILHPSLQRTTPRGREVTRYQGNYRVCRFAVRRSTENMKHAAGLSYPQSL